MKKQLFYKVFSAAVLGSIVTSTASACMMPIWPGGGYYQSDDNTKVLLVHSKGVETMIMQPSWKSSTKDFGLILPVPSRPTVATTSESVLDELENLTNMQRYYIHPLMNKTEMSVAASGAPVTVIEQKEVGQFTATVLTANDSSALTNWLVSNGYNLQTYNKENIDYYVKKGGYYFVALKVNVATVSQYKDGQYYGKLNPVSVEFSSQKPVLAMRSLYSDAPTTNFTLYTLSDRPYYVPGSEYQFARPLNSQDLQSAPVLKSYAKSGSWLTRSLVTFDPKQIKEDLVLSEAVRTVRINDISGRRLINPQVSAKTSGITAVSLATPLFMADKKAVIKRFDRNLKTGSKGTDVTILQYLLKSKGYLGEDNQTGVYDEDTKEAVIAFQEEYSGDILKPNKLENGTGVVSTLTRKILNREFFQTR